MSIDGATLDHLANPFLASLLTELAPFSKTLRTADGVAARATLRDLPLGGYAGETRAAGFDALLRLVAEAGPTAVVAYDEDEVRALESECGARAFGGALVQMAFTARPARWPAGDVAQVVDLDDRDYPGMRALVDLTEPGPLSVDSPGFGRFVGIREGGASAAAGEIDATGGLVAMGGLRAQTDRAAELTLICTHPCRQRRGLASRIVATLVDRTRAEGRTPFLHAFETNRPAIAAYERLGFVHSRTGRILIVSGRA
jgi:ribosomal protein S18 acetylase RimI-like enzyme